jgi:hypothetical protein
MSSKHSWIAVGIALLTAGDLPATAEMAPGGAPVVVELFTSQGCNSCPPADALLAELAQRPGVVALAFHVDYWDYIGWKDPFASPQWTQRQRDYSRALGLRMVYTPQMVIDGAYDVPGSYRMEVDSTIESAAAHAKPTMSLERDASGAYWVNIPGTAELAAGPAVVWLAYCDREHVTAVKRGENAGRTLKNVNVVRDLRRVGEWDGSAVKLPLGIDASALPEDQLRDYAVIVQADPVGPIYAAISFRIGAIEGQ